MMRHMLVYGVVVILGVSLLGMSGCASTPPTRFYILPALTSTDTALAVSPVKRDVTVSGWRIVKSLD